MMTDIFQAIDSATSLEAMLHTIQQIATDQGDYAHVCKARYHLERIKLGLPITISEGPTEVQEQLERAQKEFAAEAAENYKAREDFAHAAPHFFQAKMYQEAITMYLAINTKDSLAQATFLALHYDVDYKLGFDLRIRQGKLGYAFDDLDGLMRHDHFHAEDKQHWAEYLVRAAYTMVVSVLQEKIQKKEGSSPEGKTIPEILQGRALRINESDVNLPFNRIFDYVRKSTDLKIMQMGLDLNECVIMNIFGTMSQQEQTMYLRGKLTGNQEYVDFFIEQAKQKKSKGEHSFNYPARRAIEILTYHQHYAAAVDVAEEFLEHPQYELLEKSGDRDRLLSAYKNSNDPVAYALERAKVL